MRSAKRYFGLWRLVAAVLLGAAADTFLSRVLPGGDGGSESPSAEPAGGLAETLVNDDVLSGS